MIFKHTFLNSFYLLITFYVLIFSAEQTDSSFRIIMEPPFDTLNIPENKISILSDEASCYEDITNWDTLKLTGTNLSLKFFFHSGSGRYWTIGIYSSDSSGLFVNTTTIGFRNLKRYIDGRLPWKYDFNNDGVDEFIFWDSFLAFESQTNGDFGLIAWVYEIFPNNLLVLNKKYTCQIWDKVIQSHSLDSDTTDNILENLSIKKRHQISDMIKLKKIQYESEF